MYALFWHTVFFFIVIAFWKTFFVFVPERFVYLASLVFLRRHGECTESVTLFGELFVVGVVLPKGFPVTPGSDWFWYGLGFIWYGNVFMLVVGYVRKVPGI